MEKIRLKMETVQIKSRKRRLKSLSKFEVGSLLIWIDPDIVQELEQFLIKEIEKGE
jgi:hypothetical protein